MDEHIIYIALFLIYSIIGWIAELIFCSLSSKKIILNRGFLIGPYCPIYGTGALTMIFLLERYQTDPVVLFIMSGIVATILEYLTSYFMEKLFKARWWDYSKNSFNLNGRVCLKNTVLFGFGGLIIMYVINPFFENILFKANTTFLSVITIFMIIVFLVDVVISSITIINLKINIKEINKDMTEEISKKVREALRKRRIFTKRLLNAFPDAVIEKREQILLKIKEIVNKD